MDYYDGSYYCIGGERKTVHEDKTADEDFFPLKLVAVAKEIKTRGLPRTLRVVLGVGVPFKRFGKEQAKLVAYLKRSGPHFIEFEEKDYVITIENVYCFPQCFAAVADRMGNMHGRYIVADIGSWTKDIIFIDERKVQPDKCVTVPNSIITLFQEINNVLERMQTMLDATVRKGGLVAVAGAVTDADEPEETDADMAPPEAVEELSEEVDDFLSDFFGYL